MSFRLDDKIKTALFILLLTIFALLISLIFLLSNSFFKTNNKTISKPINIITEKNSPDFKNITTNKQPENTYLFFGDIMLDRHINDKIKTNGFDYLLEKIPSSLFENKNLISANLEGAVTNSGKHYAPINSNDFAFDPEIVNKFHNYNFNFFSIANNHLADQGKTGIIETTNNLSKLNYNFSGCGDAAFKNTCAYEIIDINNKKVSMLSLSMVYDNFDINQAKSLIKQLKNESDLVIINIHWGQEYKHNFNKSQELVAHQLADSGADLIIGHHPHVVQGLEIYNNTPIFYSLGNFIFDQYFSQETQEGLAIKISSTETIWKLELLPFEMTKAQPMLLDNSKKMAFLKKFVNWSKLDIIYQEQLLENSLELNISN